MAATQMESLKIVYTKVQLESAIKEMLETKKLLKNAAKLKGKCNL